MNSTIKPKLWIVSELFYPDQTSTSYILSKIADKMVEKYDVTVITDSALYQDDTKIQDSYFKINKNIKIVRVFSKKRDKNNLLQRTKKVISLSFKLSIILWKSIRKGEKVFIVTNPAPLLVLVSWIKKIKKIELTILVHDVFPENTIPSGVIKSKKSPTYKIIAAIFNKAYSNADSLIVLGRDMKEVVEKKVKRSNKKPKIIIIENWGDIESIIPNSNQSTILKERHSKDTLTIQYAGNIGRAQGLDTFLECFNLSSNKKMRFDLWGNGAVKNKLIGLVNELELQGRVTFNSSYSREQQNQILSSSDIALVILAKGMYGLGVPSKAYNILAAGIPILFIGNLNSEIALLIKEQKVGYCFSSGDEAGIIQFLDNFDFQLLNELKKMGKNARIVVEKKYSEEIILSKFMEVL